MYHIISHALVGIYVNEEEARDNSGYWIIESFRKAARRCYRNRVFVRIASSRMEMVNKYVSMYTDFAMKYE